jgi:hypothetical protein
MKYLWQCRYFLRLSGISHSFSLFSTFFSRTIQSFIHPFAEGPLLFPHCSSLSRAPPWGAEPGFELGPAVQQADALPFELRRTPVPTYYYFFSDTVLKIICVSCLCVILKQLKKTFPKF